MVVPRAGNPRRRSLLSFAVALLVHGAAFAAAGFFVATGSVTPELPPVTVDLQPASPEALASAGAPLPSTDAATSAGVASAAAGSGGADASGFVIPTPRASTDTAAPAPSGSSFRTAGGTAAGAASLPALQGPPTAPAVSSSQSGQSSTSAGTGSQQRSGQGVAVGQPAGGSSQSLDLSALDKKGSGGTGAATGTRGSAGGTAAGAAQAAGVTGPGYNVILPDAARGRKVVHTVTPDVRAAAGAQGLTLKVRVTFTLDQNGVVRGVSVIQGSGNQAVDNAVVEAVRLWIFTPAPGAPLVQGEIPFVIDVH